MKTRLIYLLLLLSPFCINAQSYCDTVFHIVPESASFYGYSFAGGDSALSVDIVNISAAQSMAYPTAKIIHLSPLPAGMILTTSSLSFNTVFASAYNPGDTMPVIFYYNVSQAIPLDYTVWFQLMADADNNNGPIDSCAVQDSFLVNLNPSITSQLSEIISEIPQIRIFAQHDKLSIKGYSGLAKIYDFSGKELYQFDVNEDIESVHCNLNPGIYIFRTADGRSKSFRAF